jgi:signal peptidase I
MTASNKSLLNSLSTSAQAARDEAKRIAKTQPVTKVGHEKDVPHDGARDTIESIVIAFVFAFLFRTFIAEAFIIPTGSMAETLYGRHKDVHCPQCKTRFRVGASEEIDRENGYFLPNQRLKYGFCPNCRFQMDIEDELPFAGDRILVNKFPYEFMDPRRFDVVVFKFPEDPKTSYIKRLIGLPGEAISILSGDLFRQDGELGKSEILRKPLNVQQETQILVYDNDKPAEVLLDQGFPERWAPVKSSNPETPDPEGWQPEPKTRSFEIDGTQQPNRESWLRYRHYLPQPVDWQRVNSSQRIEAAPQLMLIADNYSYNSGYGAHWPASRPEMDSVGEQPFWVGDLTLNCELEVLASHGRATLELVEGRRKYHCDFDLASGLTTLSYQDESFRRGQEGDLEDIPIGQAQTSVGKPGKYQLSFANVNDRLALSINGRWVKFQHGTEPTDGSYELPQQLIERLPTNQDLSPIGISAQETHIRINHLLVQRDTFYTNTEKDSQRWYPRDSQNRSIDPRSLLQDPAEYARSFAEYNEKLGKDRYVLGQDEFLVLGDNSPRSADSRMWGQRPYHPYAVSRRHLIGKAFLIYWPHGIPFLNNGRGYSPHITLRNRRTGRTFMFWHQVLKYDDNNQPYVESSDYASNAIPFYPQPMPWMSKEGRWFKWIR